MVASVFIHSLDPFTLRSFRYFIMPFGEHFHKPNGIQRTKRYLFLLFLSVLGFGFLLLAR